MSETSPDAGTIGRLATQRSHYKQQSRQALKERDEARQQLADAGKQLDELKKGDPSGRVKELEGQLRTLKHRAAFDRLARERGAADEALDDLFDLLKYRAEKDDPDEGVLGKLLDDAAQHPARGRFFAKGDGDGDGDGGRDREGGEPTARREPPPDAGRGARHRPEGSIVLTRDQLADPKFMLDPANRARIKGAKIRA